MKARWIVGGAAAAQAPADWREPLQNIDAQEAELRALALAGQFIAFAPPAAPKLQSWSDLPALGLPVLPNALRAAFRRAMAAAQTQRSEAPLLALLARRGYTAHPGDWMPETADVADLYAPWQQWRSAGMAEASHEAPHETLDETTWELFRPQERRAALLKLRHEEPARARALIEARAAGEAAEARVQLVELLATSLSVDDAPFLDSLATDRSQKVKDAAAKLLSRLRKDGVATADAQELAGFLEPGTKGLIRRERTVAPRPLKTPAQQMRRAQLFGAVSFADLATALSFDIQALTTAWRLGDDTVADRQFVEMAARSAPDETMPLLCDRILAADDAEPLLLALAAQRLPQDGRRDLAVRAFQRKNVSFQLVAALAGDRAGFDDRTLEQAHAAGAVRALLGGAGAAVEAALSAEFFALGLLASADAARQIIDDFVAAGLPSLDPKLDMLRFNAALHEGRIR